MKEILIELIGEYVPLAEVGIASIDWPWIAGAAVVILSVWCFFRGLWGALFGRR